MTAGIMKLSYVKLSLHNVSWVFSRHAEQGLFPESSASRPIYIKAPETAILPLTHLPGWWDVSRKGCPVIW